jgi:hypothetical protein
MRYALQASFAAFLLFAPGAAAQSIPSPYRYIEATQSASAFAGWLLTDTGDNETGPQSGPLLGGRYTVRLSGPLSGEVGLGILPTQRTVQRRISAAGDTLRLEPVEDVNALVLIGEAGLRFHLTGPRTWKGLAPYVAASGGGVWDVLGTSSVDETLEESQRVDFGPGFAVGLGAGTDWFLSERLALRLEARDYVWRLTTPPGLTQAGQQEETQWTNNLGLTLGVAVYF